MDRMTKIFALLVIVFTLNSCSATNMEWLKLGNSSQMEHSTWVFIPNEPFAAQKRFKDGWAR